MPRTGLEPRPLCLLTLVPNASSRHVYGQSCPDIVQKYQPRENPWLEDQQDGSDIHTGQLAADKTSTPNEHSPNRDQGLR